MKVGIVVFPGTNCEEDTYRALKFLGFNCSYIFHNEDIVNLFDYRMIILAGGFSFGDYIASGRLAKFSPIICKIKEYIENKAGLELGICNGFQILCEANLLPGVLTFNNNNKFISKSVNLKLNYGEFRFYILLMFFLSLAFERLFIGNLLENLLRKWYNKLTEKMKKGYENKIRKRKNRKIDK